MIRRPEIIRTPVYPGPEITWTRGERNSGWEEYRFLLPSGERLALARAEDSRELGDIPSLMSRELQKILLVEHGGFCDLAEIASEVLKRQFGLERRQEVSHWAERIANGDSVVDKIFPHWLFISILARARFNRIYSLSKPRFVTYRPSLSALEEWDLSREELSGFEVRTPPILTGTAVPLLGNFGSNVCAATKPEYVLLRQRTGPLAPGKYNFPGGRADKLLELTAWEEAKEEMPAVMFGERRGIDESVTMLLRRVDFLTVADQVLIGEDGGLHRFLNYTFAFWFAFPYSGGGVGFVPVEECLEQIKGVDGDRQGEWMAVMLDKETMELSNPEIRENLSPIASIAMDVVKSRLGH